jgi:hypothetical protein
MRDRLRSIVVPALSLAALLPVAAAADDLCLVPQGPVPAPGGTLRVELRSGGPFPGAAIDWRPGAAREFFLLDSRGRLDLKGLAPEGAALPPAVPLRGPGTTIVALVTEPDYVTLGAREFQETLKRDGHDDILDMRARMNQRRSPGRERERRYTKTIVDVAGESSDVALVAVKMTLEILPETRPSALRAGGRLPVRVLFEGAPDAGALLCAGHAGAATKSGGYAWCGRLDDAGRASVPVLSAGWQLLRTTRVRALAGDERADWASYAATLTFEVPAGAPPAGTVPARATHR